MRAGKLDSTTQETKIMKPLDTIEYKNCKILIHQDETPENPFESWDCEPPLLTYYGGRHGYFKAYGEIEDLRDIIAIIPDSCFERGERMKLFKEYISDRFTRFTLREFAGDIQSNGSFKDAFCSILVEYFNDTPSNWRNATEWMELAESLLSLAGITCYQGQSNGYSQGDSTLVLAIATPNWLKTSGVAKRNESSAMKCAFDLYSAWAWGDVYGYTLEDENGDELIDSCWGFYGSDHQESGLLEGAQNAIDCHLETQAK